MQKFWLVAKRKEHHLPPALLIRTNILYIELWFQVDSLLY